MYYLLRGLYILMLAYNSFMTVSILLSWIFPLHGTRFYAFFRKGADLYLKPFRGWVVIGIIDFTPIIGFAIYNFALNCFGMLLNMFVN